MINLPFDIIINHIIPFTYCIQSNLLLEDIKNYYEVKNKLLDGKFDINLIKHEILAIFFDKEKVLNSILNRSLSISLIKNINKDNIYFFSDNKIFSLLLGLFSKNERIKFLNHILEDNGIWFKKY